MPMLPPAPGLFSMTNGCPSDWLRRSPTIRASASAGPPGGNGTRIRTALLGYGDCAAAVYAMLHARSIKPARATARTNVGVRDMNAPVADVTAADNNRVCRLLGRLPAAIRTRQHRRERNVLSIAHRVRQPARRHRPFFRTQPLRGAFAARAFRLRRRREESVQVWWSPRYVSARRPRAHAGGAAHATMHREARHRRRRRQSLRP